jgi:hypothetical protein
VTLHPDVELSDCKTALSLPSPYHQRQGAFEAKAMTTLPCNPINRHLGATSRRLDVTFKNTMLFALLIIQSVVDVSLVTTLNQGSAQQKMRFIPKL